MTACGILNQDGQRKGADSCLAIRHKDAMTDDEIIFAVEAFAFDAGPVTAERRNRGFTLFHVATGTPIARLRPVKGHDGLFDILYWSLWKERWVHFGMRQAMRIDPLTGVLKVMIGIRLLESVISVRLFQLGATIWALHGGPSARTLP